MVRDDELLKAKGVYYIYELPGLGHDGQQSGGCPRLNPEAETGAHCPIR